MPFLCGKIRFVWDKAVLLHPKNDDSRKGDIVKG